MFFVNRENRNGKGDFVHIFLLDKLLRNPRMKDMGRRDCRIIGRKLLDSWGVRKTTLNQLLVTTLSDGGG
jgi:hypothetical protein